MVLSWIRQDGYAWIFNDDMAGRQDGPWTACIGGRFLHSALRSAPATRTRRQTDRQAGTDGYAWIVKLFLVK